ncbi:MC062R [Molluscum contagiosum virus subtype 1]|uniref:Protein OPG091 n=4 Tax=Molluscum contagiosum virus TaxID=10279 RepID=A0A7G5AX63_MCV1|nr:MC062R [Molluscum contagiosum virus subtype 1]AZT86292.1 MC062R [Molluscum contagiosum virus]AAC55190.1 MC062R [Molluscum contagiosum virus subtype 1]AQY16811.1 MC062 [Molluscum contagiosum virus subtype 1]AQY16990.1 MC062 [Molluscum contagiosum virus subtype 1]AQY17169.1 MC062 [Molluscum contagiosum virus subtype 1]
MALRALPVLREHCARGAVLFSTTRYVLSNYFNPSEEKHAAIYFGRELPEFLLRERVLFPCPDGLRDDEHYVLEFNTQGMRAVPLRDFLHARHSLKVYYYTDAAVPDTETMARAAGFAFDDMEKDYGFGPDMSYCFKTVARCYARVGVRVRALSLLGRGVVLSQSFTRDPRWLCVYDSERGTTMLPWSGNFLEWKL